MTVTDIEILIDDLVDTNSTTYPLARKVRAINRNQDKIVNIILENDQMSIYDDANYPDLPEGTIALVNGQTVYDVSQDENFADLTYVIKVFVKNSAGTYYELNRYGTGDVNIKSALLNNAFGSIFNSQNFYRMSGKRIILGFTPAYAFSDGIKIYFQRAPVQVSVNDTSKELGIPTTYHQLVALMCAYDYARAKRLDNKNDLLAEVQEEKQRLGLYIDDQQPEKKTQINGTYSRPR